MYLVCAHDQNDNKNDQNDNMRLTHTHNNNIIKHTYTQTHMRFVCWSVVIIFIDCASRVKPIGANLECIPSGLLTTRFVLTTPHTHTH